MRILHVVPEVGPGDGRGRSVLEVARVQRDNGHEVHLVVAAGDAEPGMTMHRVTVPRRPWSISTLAFAVRAGWEAHALRRRDEVDLVHIHVPACCRADLVTCHGLARGAIVQADGDPDLARKFGFRSKDVGRVKSLLPFLEWNLRMPGTQVVALHDGAAHELTELVEVPEEEVTVIPNGVDGDLFDRKKLAAAGNSLRTRMGLDGAVLLFVGHDFKRKGLALALEALARLAEPRPHLLVVGADPHDGAASTRFRKMARDLGVADRVHFLGVLDPVSAAYGAADLFILPSAYEGMCLAVLEAMSSSLPVVGTDAALPETLRCEGAVAVRPDADELAQVMGRWLDDGAARIAAGVQARERARTFTWEAHAAALDVLYRRASDFRSRNRK